ncbi:MAG: hypothetical protein GY794_08835 [bacterium]|nr:hypothetical protein [bacterium]
MSFDYAFAYEDRSYMHTSRWSLSGVDTRSGGSTTSGRFWMLATLNDQSVTVQIYKTPDCDSGGLVASGSADVSDIETAPVACVLTQENTSGVSGQFWFESYLDDCGYPVEVLVTLCTDEDLAIEYSGLDDLPADVYSAARGMARHCAAASEKVLLLVSGVYARQLGGFGAPEHKYHTVAGRLLPDYRRLANPDQLKAAAVHWALSTAFGSCHELGAATMYSQLRDYHEQKRIESIEGWNLTLNLDPDTDEDADASKSSAMVRTTRL